MSRLILALICFGLVLFFTAASALPIADADGDAHATAAAATVDNTARIINQPTNANGHINPDVNNIDSSLVPDADEAADHSTDFRIDETQLAEITVQHSQAEDGSTSSSGFKLSLLPSPAKTAESVNLEHEGIPSKILSTYDNSQKKLVDLTNPMPILDTISEHEKYGNNGDMFDGLARTIVNGYEAFSNLLNTFIQKPKEIARSISKGITAQLDIIGGKIVGL